MTDPIERRKKILEHRQFILENTTTEQRKEQMELLIKKLKIFGEENFPSTRNLTYEESITYNEALLKLSAPTGKNIFDQIDEVQYGC